MTIDYVKIIKEFSGKNIEVNRRETSIKEIEKFEKNNDLKLSKSYIDFLLKYNGGYSGEKNMFIVSKNKGEITINTYFGSNIDIGFIDEFGKINNFNIYSLERERKNWQGHIPDSLLPISIVSYGSLICIGVKGNDYGRIYFWDHNIDYEHEMYEYNCLKEKRIEEYFDNVIKIANSFEEFLESLITETEGLEKFKKEKPEVYEKHMKSMEKIKKKRKSLWRRLFG